MITNAVTLEQGVTVTQLKGQIYLVAADGSRKLLAEGDVLPKGAVIMSPDGASFMGGGQSFNVQPASEQSEPAEEGDAPQLAQNGAAGTPDDINALQQAILGGADPTQAFEASAAGGAPAAGGGGIGGVAGASGNGGFVTIDRTGSATIAEATFDTTYNANGELPLGAAGEDEVFDLTPPIISVVAPDNTNDTTPTLTGTTDAPAGSTVTLLVTDANGNQQTLTAIVTPSGTFTVDVVTPLAEGSYTVTATVTDPAGNTGTATDDGSVDVTATGKPTVTIVDDSNPDDGLLSTGEITGGGDGVQVKAEVNHTELTAGGKVTLTIANGDATRVVELKLVNGELQLTNGTPATGFTYNNGTINWTEATPADGALLKVEATQTDKAGNTSDKGSDQATVDVTSTGKPTVTIVDDSNPDDGLLSTGEITGGGDGVQVKAEVNHTELTAGGKVTLTIANGDATRVVELKLVNGELQLTNGTPATGFTYNNGTISWTETTPADGALLKVEATQTDKAGNTSDEGRDTATVDNTKASAPVVTIVDDKNPDDTYLTDAEIAATGNAGEVTVTVAVNDADLQAG
ncbi:retention module-containing protein, partial [Aeromonas veronii]|uniref:retention module-containing protein n=1 Tax=Aeromonas veronii TaxID=654 RepID=UPI003D1D8F04